MENLDLDTLKVKSFVTSLTEEKNQTVKGGNVKPWPTHDWYECDSDEHNCNVTVYPC